MTVAIDVDDVTFSYGETPAVSTVSLTIETGECFGLVGPNGSGKTTLLKLILGVHTPDNGRITVFGEPVESFAEGGRIGYVPQQSSRNGDTMPITVREVVAMGRYPHSPFGWFDEADHTQVEEAIETVGIEDLEDRRLSRLSGGQRQRVFIARALASDADLLALDEPTVGIDATAREEFFTLLGKLNDGGMTIVLIEHDLHAVRTHTDRIACLNRTVHSVGPATELLESATRGDGKRPPLYSGWTNADNVFDRPSEQ